MPEDPRRRIPRTDTLLDHPEIRALDAEPAVVKSVIATQQARARALDITPEEVLPNVLAELRSTGSLTPVLNATGVVVHTNLGRAPLSPAAVEAMAQAAGYVDVELDLETGQRSSSRGRGTTEALLRATPAAEDALVVNNGAAGLLLTTAALCGAGETIISRGELVEIGAGFRLPELIESTAVRLHEIGATNRTHASDYRTAAQRPDAKAILKVHPSNFRVEGFTASVDVPALREIADEYGLHLIVDLGSGLLTHDDVIPTEPDIHEALEQGADVVIASGDKLLGGPQAGILLGRKDVIAKLKKHPLHRAVRYDKIRHAGLETTVRHRTPVQDYLHADSAALRRRAEAVAAEVGAKVVPHDGRVGGGGAPGVALPGWAVQLPQECASYLREQQVLPRTHDGVCLVDLRCIPPADDAVVAERIAAALKRVQEER